MTVIADYANLYETVIRPRRKAGPRHAAALVLWAALFLVRPRLALAIWREQHIGGL